MSYSELLVALENIIIEKVATVPTARNKKIDASAPMEIGMAAKDDGESARDEGYQRIVDFALQAVYRGTGKGTWRFGKGQSWNDKGTKVAKVATMGGRAHDRRVAARKGAKGKRKVAREKLEHVGRVARQDTLQRGVIKKATTNCTLSINVCSEIRQEAVDNDEELQAWCLLEESEHEYWQEEISRKDEQQLKKAAHVSLLSVEKESRFEVQEQH